MIHRKLSLQIFLSVLASTLSIGTAVAANEITLHSFTPYLRTAPTSLIGDAAGNVYGIAPGGRYGLGMIARFSTDLHGALVETVLYTFKGGVDGAEPYGIVLDSGGNIFGLTQKGGTQNLGTFFELTPSAHGEWTEAILYNFADSSNGILKGGLAIDNAGNFYGTTDNSDKNAGSVFQLSLSPNGWTENVLHVFTGGADGGRTFGRLVFDRAGNGYGTTSLGGTYNGGVVFELTHAGGNWTEKVLHNFAVGNDGSFPVTGPILDGSGNLFGTTVFGGSGCGVSGCGTVYELKNAGGGQWSESVIYDLAQSVQADAANLSFDHAGNLYGTAFQGPVDACCGFVFELSPAGGTQWTKTTLYVFNSDTGKTPFYPNALVLTPGGQFIGSSGGVASGSIGTVFELSSGSGPRTLTAVLNFERSDGARSYTSLIADGSGSLYGTTDIGGTDNVGTVFKLAPNGSGDWKETILYTFPGLDNTVTGVYPSSLIFDSAGNLYGAAGFSGNLNLGSVFELSPSQNGTWSETTLRRFGVINFPLGNLVFDKVGNLYGTAYEGGTNGLGAVFELSRQTNGQWTQTVIYSFKGYPNDGSYPRSGLVLDDAGNLFGITEKGDATACGGGHKPIGCGTVFELQFTSGGWKKKVLHSFQGSPNDGAAPFGNLIFDASGNLFGTTSQGGIRSPACTSYKNIAGCGTVFELRQSGGQWAETVLYEFTNSNGDGVIPSGGLLLDSAGNLYGTTGGGGVTGSGTVFKLAPLNGGWTETIMHSFSGTDGQGPGASLIRDGAGNLYGTTPFGGSAGYGTVFMITP